MGNDLAAWLGAVKCGALLAPLKNQYGIDKVEELLDLDPEDVDALCALVMKSPSKQFRRALTVLRKNKLETTSPRFRYLAAKCLAECSEWDECLAMIDDEALEETKAEVGTGGQVTMHAAMQLLRGSVYEAQENWPLAARCYTSALQEDPMCYEALDRLVTHHMLSTGEQQRIGIARALAARPTLLIADEPTGNLDPDLSLDIMKLFCRFNEVGVTMLIATHDLGLVEQLGGRRIALENGTIQTTQ